VPASALQGWRHHVGLGAASILYGCSGEQKEQGSVREEQRWEESREPLPGACFTAISD